jgi:hypothetical protein
LESKYESVDIGFGSSKSAASQPMSSNTDAVKGAASISRDSFTHFVDLSLAVMEFFLFLDSVDPAPT